MINWKTMIIEISLKLWGDNLQMLDSYDDSKLWMIAVTPHT